MNKQQKALDWLRARISAIGNRTKNLSVGDDVQSLKSEESALIVAEQAVHRQAPALAISPTRFRDCYACPRCGHHFEAKPFYCHNCGQHITYAATEKGPVGIIDGRIPVEFELVHDEELDRDYVLFRTEFNTVRICAEELLDVINANGNSLTKTVGTIEYCRPQ